MREKIAVLAIVLIIIGLLLVFSPKLAAQEADDMMIEIILTVEGEIQTEDIWTTGDNNALEKPMYYIWLDYNGDPLDARYGNGAGPSAHHIRLDTGRLIVQVYNDDIIDYGWISETTTGSNEWSDTENNIQATIMNDGKSLHVIFPLSLINNPSTLEISAMASPWTTSALDNTGSDNGFNDGWIIISDTTVENSYEETDVTDELLSWPGGLSNSTVLPNFNIEKIEATLYLEEDSDGIEENGAGTVGIEIWLIIIIILIIIVLAALLLRKKK